MKYYCIVEDYTFNEEKHRWISQNNLRIIESDNNAYWHVNDENIQLRSVGIYGEYFSFFNKEVAKKVIEDLKNGRDKEEIINEHFIRNFEEFFDQTDETNEHYEVYRTNFCENPCWVKKYDLGEMGGALYIVYDSNNVEVGSMIEDYRSGNGLYNLGKYWNK